MFELIANAAKGKEIVIFLDYDGTLSPIVEDPDRAFMSNQVLSFSPIIITCFVFLITEGHIRICPAI